MSEWSSVALGDISTHIKDGTHGTHQRVESGIPFLSAKNIGRNGRLSWDKSDDFVSEFDYSAITATFIPKQGDLLLTVVGSIGRAALFDGCRVAFQRSVAFVRCGSRVLPEFLFQASCSESFMRQLERRCNVTAQAGLYLGELAKVKIPLPTVPQQKKIATILSATDTAIEKTEALIAKYQQIKIGLMRDLFDRGVLPNGQLRPSRNEAPELYQETAVGWIPSQWQLCSLESACQAIIDCPHSTPQFTQDGVLVARTMHIKDGVFLEATASRVSESEYIARVSRATPIPGDVILTREAPVGEAFVIPKGMRICLGQRVMLIKPSPMVLNGEYLVEQIYGGKLSTRIYELTAGTTNPHLNVADVRALTIVLPPYAEQLAMSARIKAINLEIQTIRNSLEKTRQQKFGLMHDLLTGKVPVKIDTPETADA
ncbi:restriction endonuclease subunit S [Pseudomonas sp. PAMC 25886]|uniref:restriction endonuclease subunit S n=1 Tax=Pseudomonas sp. PAMC 25886 TaxID=1125977 RepID=UPI0002D43D91|nr:restriction endonuclease subunit S [Pseudomonas sp. PAMC 25886]